MPGPLMGVNPRTTVLNESPSLFMGALLVTGVRLRPDRVHCPSRPWLCLTSSPDVPGTRSVTMFKQRVLFYPPLSSERFVSSPSAGAIGFRVVSVNTLARAKRRMWLALARRTRRLINNSAIKSHTHYHMFVFYYHYRLLLGLEISSVSMFLESLKN